MKKLRFTLLELVIVFTVAAMFAALLIPVAASADGKSKNAACLDNMRKCQSAAAAYAADYDGVMVMKYSDVPIMTLLWSMVMGRSPVSEKIRTTPRLESFADATCPALDVVIPERKTAGVGRFTSCYAVPYMALTGVDAKYDTDSAASRMYDLRNRQTYFNPSGSHRKAQTALDTKKLMVPEAAVIFAESYSITEKKGYFHYNFSSGSILLDMRHENKTNMVYADGHAASQDAGHFMDLKDNGFILTRNRQGELYNSVTGEKIKY